VTSLAYNSESNHLSFSVSGESGTMGSTQVTISKSLVGNIANLIVTLDGNNLQYQVTSTEDSWIISFIYSHSAHTVNVQLGSLPVSSTPTPTPTANPTSKPTAKPTNSPTTNPDPTPTVPEVPYCTLATIVVFVIGTLTVLIFKNKIPHVFWSIF
jgi:hypothetical protein